MAKPQKRYVCQACGSVANRWAGQCADCAEWNTLVEEVSGTVTPFQAKHNLQSGGRAVTMVGLDAEDMRHRRARVRQLGCGEDGDEDVLPLQRVEHHGRRMRTAAD